MLKFRLLFIALVMLLALPVFAQEGGTHTVIFDNFAFTFDESIAPNVNITQFAGDDVTLEQPGGPEVAHTQFSFYDQDLPVAGSVFGAAGSIRVYQTANFTGYEFPAQQLQQLQTLLAERPDLAQFSASAAADQESSLPFMPVFPAGQVLRARVEYVDTGSISGIRYLTLYRQDVSPFLGTEFFYTFQGISTDGSLYVSAVFPLNTELFPSEVPADFDYDAFSAAYEQYVAESVATLEVAAPEQFIPALSALNMLTDSFAIAGGGEVSPLPVPDATTPPSTEGAAPEGGDSTLGGLAGTWALVSYGPVDAPVPVIETAPITLQFSETGVGGSSGCNSYGGSFRYEEDRIEFTETVGTLMACAEQAAMDQEALYLEALSTASTFTITEDQLQIFYEGGVLTFTKTA